MCVLVWISIRKTNYTRLFGCVAGILRKFRILRYVRDCQKTRAYENNAIQTRCQKHSRIAENNIPWVREERERRELARHYYHERSSRWVVILSDFPSLVSTTLAALNNGPPSQKRPLSYPVSRVHQELGHFERERERKRKWRRKRGRKRMCLSVFLSRRLAKSKIGWTPRK